MTAVRADTMGTEFPFTPDEVAQIRSALQANGPVLCPRCTAPLGSGELIGGGGTVGFFWLYRCKPCHRGVTVGDLRGAR